MKYNKLMLVAASVIGLSSIGIAHRVEARSIEQSVANVPNALSTENSGWIDHESDPAVEARNLDREFRGVNLTPQQREQVVQARRQLRADMKQVVTSPNALGTIFRMLFSSQVSAERIAADWLGESIGTYAQSLSEILTPQQLAIWQRNSEEDARNRR